MAHTIELIDGQVLEMLKMEIKEKNFLMQPWVNHGLKLQQWISLLQQFMKEPQENTEKEV